MFLNFGIKTLLMNKNLPNFLIDVLILNSIIVNKLETNIYKFYKKKNTHNLIYTDFAKKKKTTITNNINIILIY